MEYVEKEKIYLFELVSSKPFNLQNTSQSVYYFSEPIEPIGPAKFFYNRTNVFCQTFVETVQRSSNSNWDSSR